VTNHGREHGHPSVEVSRVAAVLWFSILWQPISQGGWAVGMVQGKLIGRMEESKELAISLQVNHPHVCRKHCTLGNV